MAALDWLQQLLGGGQYGDPSTPAMPTEPLGQGQGYTADVLQHLKDVISGKVAYNGVLGPGYQGDNRALDIAGGLVGAIKGFHGSPTPGLKAISASPPVRQFDNATSQFGAFISPTEGGAARYAGKGGHMYEAQAPVSNPYDMSWREFNYFQSPDKTALRDPIPGEQWAGRAGELKQEAGQFKDVLMEAGHDGIIVRNSRTGEIMEVASFKDIPVLFQKYGLLPPLAAGGLLGAAEE